MHSGATGAYILIRDISFVFKLYSCMMLERIIPVNATIVPNAKCTMAKLKLPHTCK